MCRSFSKFSQSSSIHLYNTRNTHLQLEEPASFLSSIRLLYLVAHYLITFISAALFNLTSQQFHSKTYLNVWWGAKVAMTVTGVFWLEKHKIYIQICKCTFFSPSTSHLICRMLTGVRWHGGKRALPCIFCIYLFGTELACRLFFSHSGWPAAALCGKSIFTFYGIWALFCVGHAGEPSEKVRPTCVRQLMRRKPSGPVGGESEQWNPPSLRTLPVAPAAGPLYKKSLLVLSDNSFHFGDITTKRCWPISATMKVFKFLSLPIYWPTSN